MTIFGKSISEYIRFQKVMLLLILIVGLGRLGLSLAGVSNGIGRWLSISVAMLLGVIVYAIRVPRTDFGGYRHLLPLIVIQTALAQAIVIGGIILSIVTHKDNIYTAPEFSPPGSGQTWLHVIAHVIVIVVASIVGWGIGSLLMLVVKKSGGSGHQSAAARA